MTKRRHDDRYGHEEGHRHHRHKHKHHRHGITGRFAGVYFIHPETGEFIVADQTVPVSTAITAPLVFTDNSTGATVQGPIGVVAASDPAIVPTLSSDGQAVNVMTPASGSFTLLWHDPAGVVPDFSVTLTDQPVAVQNITGAFGAFVPGTTA